MVKGMFPPYKYGIRKGMGGVSGASIPRSGLQFYADLWHPEQQGFLLSYDGDDYLSNATADFRSADSQGAIEVWFRTSDTTGNKTIISSADTATAVRHLYIWVTATFLEVVQNDNGTESRIRATATVTDGKWHHIVVSSDGVIYTILVDGVSTSLSNISGSNDGDWFADSSARDNITVGVKLSTGLANYTVGEIGYTRIYSRPMLQPEAQLNYQRGRKAAASDTTGLVFNLPTTEGTGNPVDTVGSLTMTLTGATWVEGLMDRSINALPMTSFGSPTWGNTGRTFDGINDTIILKHNSIFNYATGDFTWSMWYKPTELSAQRLLYKGSQWAITVKDASGSLFFRGMQDGSNYARVTTSNTHLVAGVASMITGVKSGSSIYLYFNNALDGAAPSYAGLGALSNIDTTTDIYIASEGQSANWSKGLLSEVFLYNRALTAQEIQTIFNSTRHRYGV